MHIGLDGDLGREAQELLAIPPREIRHRAHHALLPENAIGEAGNVAHVNPGADDGPALDRGAQRGGHERPDRREDNRRIQGLRRLDIGAAGPDRAQLPRERLRLIVAGPGEGVDLLPLVNRHLGQDVRRRAEAVEAQALHVVAGEPIGAVADQTRAEQRRGLRRVGDARHREGVALMGHGVFRVAAIQRVACELRMLAEILLLAPAEAACLVGVTQPGDAHPSAARQLLDVRAGGRHLPHDLVAQDEGQLRIGQIAI